VSESAVEVKRSEEAEMLGSRDVVATIAVRDIGVASAFYEGTLGLKWAEYQSPDPTAILYRSGNTAVLVYQSAYAGTNQATAASWGVGDELDSIVLDLASKGVTFEHYDDLPETTREGDIHVMGPLRTVWFKDPDGNILNIVNQFL
jgi:catechol 2,3-dioxygenase-like lactoylglutathione lyase family enzyme